MSVIERRVFYGKPGKADKIVEICNEFIELLTSTGSVRSSRVLTDHLSGRTDRVVLETEVDSLAVIEADMQRLGADGQMAARFEESFSRLVDLIDWADVDYWTPR